MRSLFLEEKKRRLRLEVMELVKKRNEKYKKTIQSLESDAPLTKELLFDIMEILS